MTEMEYQMSNWYYFTWLSGDFNVEQFVHQYDLISWAMNDEYPIRCYSTGGRQARTGPDHGHIYDHFSSVFHYASDAQAFTTTRHQLGCDNVSEFLIVGTKGTVKSSGAICRSRAKMLGSPTSRAKRIATNSSRMRSLPPCVPVE